MINYYFLIRKLHLYFGLFISPFVIIFSLGLFVFNHPGLMQKIDPVNQLSEIRAQIRNVNYEGADLKVAKAIIKELNITGEINFISRNKNSIFFPVIKPGLKSEVRVDLKTDSVRIKSEYEGPVRATAWLHSMPGPHNVNVRGNSFYIKAWRGIADTVVYLLLFLTISGIILWYSTGLERKSGLVTLILGILFFIALLILTF